MVADDEELLRTSLAAWLAKDGYVVDVAASGREAAEMAVKKDYAIYFIDLKMPGGMDGIEHDSNLDPLNHHPRYLALIRLLE